MKQKDKILAAWKVYIKTEEAAWEEYNLLRDKGLAEYDTKCIVARAILDKELNDNKTIRSN